jgi:hypothetical protein
MQVAAFSTFDSRFELGNSKPLQYPHHRLGHPSAIVHAWKRRTLCQKFID